MSEDSEYDSDNEPQNKKPKLEVDESGDKDSNKHTKNVNNKAKKSNEKAKNESKELKFCDVLKRPSLLKRLEGPAFLAAADKLPTEVQGMLYNDSKLIKNYQIPFQFLVKKSF